MQFQGEQLEKGKMTETEEWMQGQLYILEQEVIESKEALDEELNLIYQRQQELINEIYWTWE